MYCGKKWLSLLLETIKMAKVILVVFVLFCFFSCTKESQDYRDQYTGIYRGVVIFDLPGWHHSRENSAFIIKGARSNELAIQTLGISSYSIAVLSNSSYIYYPFQISSTDNCGVTSIAVYRGKGIFSGDSLCERGTITVSSNGVSESGVWETKMKKQ